MPDHNAIYHSMFSHAGMVTELLRSFVAEPWLDDMDLGRMETVSPKFQAGNGLRREGDIIWRIPMRNGGDSYLLLMLEFQSTVDRWMALRVLVYAGLLWQQAVKENRLPPDRKLPPVFPLVIYNGDPRWAAPVDLADLIGLPRDSPLWKWQPSMRYAVVDEGAFGDADLASRDNLAALLFRLENSPEPDAIEALVDAVIDWFRRHDGFEALRSVFAVLAHRAAVEAEELRPGARVAENLLEVKTMLANRPAQWKARWSRIGEATMLTRQLERRFGPLPEAVRERLDNAEAPLLEEWGLRLLDAPTLDAVFD